WLFPWMEPESLQRDFAKDIFSGNPLPPFPSDFRIQMLRAIGPVPVVRSPSGGYTYPAPWSNWRGGKSPYESFLCRSGRIPLLELPDLSPRYIQFQKVAAADLFLQVFRREGGDRQSQLPEADHG